LTSGRPIFNYLAQLDRARIWAAFGNLDESLASLPAARAALRSDRAAVLAQVDELEARLRLAAGDYGGALRLATRLPAHRRMVAEAIIHLGAGRVQQGVDALKDAPARGATIRADLELRLLRADIAIAQHSPQATRLVSEALELADRHGFVQTVLETAPQLVARLVSGSVRYPPTANLSALVAAGVAAHKLARSRSRPSRLPDPLTDAEIRVLEKLPQRLSYADIAGDLHLSLNTVKTHLRHTFMKLGVSSRSAAVQRAASLGFL
jgi:LuxR family maltose regulon positive regulatory protein